MMKRLLIFVSLSVVGYQAVAETYSCPFSDSIIKYQYDLEFNTNEGTVKLLGTLSDLAGTASVNCESTAVLYTTDGANRNFTTEVTCPGESPSTVELSFDSANSILNGLWMNELACTLIP